MQQYFISGNREKQITITDNALIKHMFHVMRLKNEEEVVFVFDDGKKYLAKVSNQETHQFELLNALDEDNELPVQVTIASGFPKGDKLEFIAQKVTELGASSLWGFPADWSVSKWDNKKLTKKKQKLEKIVLGAAEQSKRNTVPTIQLFEKKQDFLDKVLDFDIVVIAYEESAKAGETAQLVNIYQTIPLGANILFVFGSEGGLSPEEVTQLTDLGGVVAGLGPRIMRTETAPLYVLSSLSYALELLGRNS